jgi:two-component system phosphate regulon sensor histidine kinase PhoR
MHFDADRYTITADRTHFSNIVNNLLDNANKYSPEKPEIDVFTRNLNGTIQIDVTDRGIGISKENQQDVFKKFHRLQVGDIHDVKGFGLGLFYVKTMVEEMGGSIGLKSETAQGTSFTLNFPL